MVTERADRPRRGSLATGLRLISRTVAGGFIAQAALAAATPADIVAQITARDTLPIVTEVKIEGNEAFSDQQIGRAIATRASGCKSFLFAPLCWVGWDLFRRVERLDPRELRTDLARIRVFYFRRGYRRAEADTTVIRDDREVEVTFHVEEGVPVILRALEVRGLDDLPDAGDVADDIALQPGEPFSEVKLIASQDRIERELGNRGYPDAAVLVESSIPAADTLGAHVVLNVMPGPRARIDSITVEGIQELDTGDVKRLLTFESGDLFEVDEIVRSQRRLYSMALFNYVDISRTEVRPDSTLSIRVLVSEADMQAVRVGVGLSTTECAQLEAGWAHRNFFGGTRRFELSGVLSNIGTSQLARSFPCTQAGLSEAEAGVVADAFNKLTWRLRADFQQPWFLDTENVLNLGIFTERQSLPRIYARLSYGGDVRFSREIGPNTGLALGYRASRDSLEEGSADLLFCANFGVCRPRDIRRLSETRWLSPVSVNLVHNRADAILDPSRGYRLSLEGEHASRLTGSQWAYYRMQGEASWYQRLGDKVLALRVRAGLVEPIGSGLEDVDFIEGVQDDVTHPLKRQYAGGANTVRGYGQNLLGPKILLADSLDLVNKSGCDAADITDENFWPCDPSATDSLSSSDVAPRPVGGERGVVGNIELRFPLSTRWSAVAFLDVGKVWTPGGEIRVAEDLAWSPGLGVRYRSPVGPIRLDLGYNTGEPEQLPVVSVVKRNNENVIVQLGSGPEAPNLFEYDPFGGRSFFEKFVNRLQLHISIGQAF